MDRNRKEIWEHILDKGEDFINFVVNCRDINKLRKYYGELVYLTNTNSYPIPEKNRLYLKGRIEELETGVINSDLRPSPMEDVLNIFAPVEENVEEEIAPIIETKEEPKTEAKLKKI